VAAVALDAGLGIELRVRPLAGGELRAQVLGSEEARMPLLAANPQGGLHLGWLEEDDEGAPVFALLELGPDGSVGARRRVHGPREHPLEFALVSSPKGDLHVVWTQAVDPRNEAAGRSIWSCQLGREGQPLDALPDCPRAVTGPDERARGRIAAACAERACWVAWLDGSIRVKPLSASAPALAMPRAGEEGSATVLSTPAMAATTSDALLVWGESDEASGWQLRGQWLGRLEPRAGAAGTAAGQPLVLAAAERPDKPMLLAVGGTSDVLVLWRDPEDSETPRSLLVAP
jgi:hypothetical protein